jgi:hypothetical protein
LSPVAGLWQIALPAIVVLAVAAPVVGGVGGVAALAGDHFVVAAQYTFFGGAIMTLGLTLLRSRHEVFIR